MGLPTHAELDRSIAEDWITRATAEELADMIADAHGHGFIARLLALLGKRAEARDDRAD